MYINQFYWQILLLVKRKSKRVKLVVVYLKCNLPPTPRDASLNVIFKIGLLHKEGNNMERTDNHKFTHTESDRGYTSFIALDELLDPTSGYVTDNQATFYIDINKMD